MSKTPKDKNNTPENTSHHHDEVVNGMPGASVIDIGELRRAQASEDADDLDLSSDESDNDMSLDEEANLIRAELANDPELKKDVLEGYSADSSNENLENIANRVTEQQLQEIAQMEVLAG